jgi:hypothetical protein
VDRVGIDVNFIVDGDDDNVATRTVNKLAELSLASAWLTASLARTGDPVDHDTRLTHACMDIPELDPIPVLVPPVASGDAFGRARKISTTATCRVARVCPSGHGYPLADWVLSPIPELCVREGLALQIDFDPEPIRWQESVAFARTFPRLPLILLGTAIGEDRALPAALDAAPNLVIHVSETNAATELIELVQIFGTSRFVWGSAFSSIHPSPNGAAAYGLLDGAYESILYRNAQALADGTYADAFL